MLPPAPWTPVLFDDPDRPAEETAFLRAIVDNPDDDVARLVFADWLDEHGLADKAEFVRLEVELNHLPRSAVTFATTCRILEQLAEAVGGMWSWALVRPARLLNCGSAEAQDS